LETGSDDNDVDKPRRWISLMITSMTINVPVRPIPALHKQNLCRLSTVSTVFRLYYSRSRTSQYPFAKLSKSAPLPVSLRACV